MLMLCLSSATMQREHLIALHVMHRHENMKGIQMQLQCRKCTNNRNKTEEWNEIMQMHELATLQPYSVTNPQSISALLPKVMNIPFFRAGAARSNRMVTYGILIMKIDCECRAVDCDVAFFANNSVQCEGTKWYIYAFERSDHFHFAIMHGIFVNKNDSRFDRNALCVPKKRVKHRNDPQMGYSWIPNFVLLTFVVFFFKSEESNRR